MGRGRCCPVAEQQPNGAQHSPCKRVTFRRSENLERAALDQLLTAGRLLPTKESCFGFSAMSRPWGSARPKIIFRGKLALPWKNTWPPTHEVRRSPACGAFQRNWHAPPGGRRHFKKKLGPLRKLEISNPPEINGNFFPKFLGFFPLRGSSAMTYHAALFRAGDGIKP